MASDPTITVEYRCTTHHNACACIEARYARELAALRTERDALRLAWDTRQARSAGLSCAT